MGCALLARCSKKKRERSKLPFPRPGPEPPPPFCLHFPPAIVI